MGTTKGDLAPAYRAFNQAVNIQTPYGAMLQHVDLSLAGGKTYKLLVISPFAFIWHLCAYNLAFARFFHLHCCGMCRLALYSDAITPGNVLRLDSRSEWGHSRTRHVMFASTAKGRGPSMLTKNSVMRAYIYMCVDLSLHVICNRPHIGSKPHRTENIDLFWHCPLLAHGSRTPKMFEISCPAPKDLPVHIK